jgi:hypothetical protein
MLILLRQYPMWNLQRRSKNEISIVYASNYLLYLKWDDNNRITHKTFDSILPKDEFNEVLHMNDSNNDY